MIVDLRRKRIRSARIAACIGDSVGTFSRVLGRPARCLSSVVHDFSVGGKVRRDADRRRPCFPTTRLPATSGTAAFGIRGAKVLNLFLPGRPRLPRFLERLCGQSSCGAADTLEDACCRVRGETIRRVRAHQVLIAMASLAPCGWIFD